MQLNIKTTHDKYNHYGNNNKHTQNTSYMTSTINRRADRRKLGTLKNCNIITHSDIPNTAMKKPYNS